MQPPTQEENAMGIMIRKNLILDDVVWGEVVEWRFSQRINTESDALRNLIGAGLHYYRLTQDDGFVAAEQDAIQRLGLGGVQEPVEQLLEDE